MGPRRVRLSRAAAVVCAATVIVTTVDALAFSLKHTKSGVDVRWNVPHVDLVVDPALNEKVTGGSQALSSASRSWSGSAGAPSISAQTGQVGSKPAIDRTNSVLYLHDFEPAGSALAITIVSFEEATGYLVDTDIVINADHSFAVLPSGARASSDSPYVSTEGNAGGGSSRVFDLTHVTAHEIGHALGLADESSNAAALMYPYTKAGDASVRTPGSDDVSGIDQAYAGANLDSGSAKGCGGGASVTGRRSAGNPWSATLLLVGAGGWLVYRRRQRGLVPCAMVLAALVVAPGRAQSAGPVSPVDATARVMAATTRNADGVFQTTLELVPRTCRMQLCPARAVAHVWGGTIDGITQRVGESPVPSVDDEVDVTFGAPVEGDVKTPSAIVVAVRPLAAPLPYR